MAAFYITEFADTGMNFPTVATQPPVAEQKLGPSISTASAIFNAKTALVRCHTDTVCTVEFAGAGALPTATTSTMRMAANQTEYFIVPRGQNYSLAVLTTGVT
jgi:hypothetical protein